MTSPTPDSKDKTGVIMTLFVVSGAPMAYYVWHTFSDLLSGHVHGPSLAMAAIVLGALIVLLRTMARYVRDK